MQDVFALGDCAGFLENTGRPVLPALAQVSSFFYTCYYRMSKTTSKYAIFGFSLPVPDLVHSFKLNR